MDRAIKREWVKALLSGKYGQGRGGLLRSDGTFCCLGVLGHVCGIPQTELAGLPYLEGENEPTSLPWEVQWSLALLNDAGVPFEMIAGLIDEAL